MAAFWALTILVGYGCFHGGGLIDSLDGMLGESNTTFIQQFPLLGSLKLSTIIGLAVLVVSALAIHRILSRPKVADALIDTETEMYKCTWPGWGETWQGTMAVAATVLALFLFLTIVDYFLTEMVGSLI